MNKPKFTAAEVIKVIPGTHGVISTIAKRLGCTWWTAKKYIRGYPTIKRAYEDERAGTDDMAISVVIKALKSGDLHTAKWWISKKLPEFSDRLALTMTGPVVLRVVYDGEEEDDDAETQKPNN